MKKFLALILAMLMLVAVAACGNNNDETDDGKKDNDTPVAENALEILNKTWALYTDDEKFPAGGGAGDDINWEGAGKINLSAEDQMASVCSWFHVEQSTMDMIDDAATIMHSMNTNTFTAGVFHLKNAADKDTFVTAVKDGILNARWMCGFPEKLVVIVVGDYVAVAYGHAGLLDEESNTISPFVEKLKSAYSMAEVVVDQGIEA